MTKKQPDIAIIGAGPAGLMAAEVAAQGGARVTIYDAMPSAGRKFLMAGRGGLNLTHSEDFERFIARYGEATAMLRPALEAFTPNDLRAWSEALGQPTFVGSSGRVFPQAFKASPLLRAWLRRLVLQGVAINTRHRWLGWDKDDALRFATPDGEMATAPRATVLALGGGSWPKLGSDGAWVAMLQAAGIAVKPLRSANCGFAVPWSDHLRERFAGTPLKGIALKFCDISIKGEALITKDGIEGGAVYALSAMLRKAVSDGGEAIAELDLRPDQSIETLAARLAAPRGRQSLSTWLRKRLSLSPVAIALLHETTPGAASFGAEQLAQRLKALPLRLTGIAPIERAISTAGGIARDELDERFMLHKRPGVFAAGEMLDWDAPTGGYLLQASFATGAAAGRGALEWLKGL